MFPVKGRFRPSREGRREAEGTRTRTATARRHRRSLVTVADAPALRVLAVGRPTVRRPERGDVLGLRLTRGDGLAAVVMHTYTRGLYAGAGVLWVLDRRIGPGTAAGGPALAGARPLLPPLIVHREVWVHGCAFAGDRLQPDHPLLQKRVVFTDPSGGGCRDLHDQQVDPNHGDVVGRCNLVFLRGLDQRLGRSSTAASLTA